MLTGDSTQIEEARWAPRDVLELGIVVQACNRVNDALFSAIVPMMLKRFCLCCCALFFLLPATSLARDYQHVAPIQLTHDAEKWADKTLRKLSLEEKIGQMFMLRAHAEFLNIASPEFLQLRDQVKRYHVGGLLLTVRAEGPFLYRNQPYEAATFTNLLQQLIGTDDRAGTFADGRLIEGGE